MPVRCCRRLHEVATRLCSVRTHAVSFRRIDEEQGLVCVGSVRRTGSAIWLDAGRPPPSTAPGAAFYAAPVGDAVLGRAAFLSATSGFPGRLPGRDIGVVLLDAQAATPATERDACPNRRANNFAGSMHRRGRCRPVQFQIQNVRRYLGEIRRGWRARRDAGLSRFLAIAVHGCSPFPPVI